MDLSKQNLETLLKDACRNVGETGSVEMPAAVAEEFARLLICQNESDLRTAACVVLPPLQLLLAMGAVAGPANAVADLERGRKLLEQAL